MTKRESDSAKAIYDEMLGENIKLFKALREAPDSQVESILKQFYQSDSYRGVPGFTLGMDFINLISPRYYIQGVDITTAMREKIYLEEYGKENENWKYVREALKWYERECFQEYINCLIGQPESKYNDNFANYIDCLKEMHKFLGVNSATPWYDCPKAFRELVRETINARKKVQIIVSFRIGTIPEDIRSHYNKESMSMEEALDLCDIIIDNIERIEYVDKNAKTKMLFKEEGYTYDDILSLITNYDEEDTEEGLRKLIAERFPTNYIEQTGVIRELYKKYFNDPVYFPYKKLCVAMALFIEPYSNLDNDDSKDNCILENVELFMNQNNLSINSTYATLTPFDSLLDEDIRRFLQEGLSLDIIAYMMQRFARTGKDFN